MVSWLCFEGFGFAISGSHIVLPSHQVNNNLNLSFSPAVLTRFPYSSNASNGAYRPDSQYFAFQRFVVCNRCRFLVFAYRAFGATLFVRIVRICLVLGPICRRWGKTYTFERSAADSLAMAAWPRIRMAARFLGEV